MTQLSFYLLKYTVYDISGNNSTQVGSRTSYAISTGVLSLGINWARCDAVTHLQLVPRVKYRWIYISHFPHFLMAECLIR
jgi:hypothetical protein